MRVSGLLLFAGVLAFGLIFGPLTVYAGCDDKTQEKATYDRSWIKSNLVVFYASHGKIYKRSLKSDKPTLLADHGFDYTSSQFELSPDGRFILYSGYHNGFSYYVYDTRKNEDYKISNERMPNFRISPDSTKIALVEDGMGKPAASLKILDIIDHKTTTVQLPSEIQSLKDYRVTEPRWSLDGTDVYLGIIAYPTGMYLKYSLEGQKLTKIDGKHQGWNNNGNNEGLGFHFIDQGKEVPFFRSPCMQWQCGGAGIPEPGETANIDKDFNLVVRTPDGKEVAVDKGEYNNCEGVTIRIGSWFERGQYLLYQAHGESLIYGVSEKKKAHLFDPGQVEFFGWEDKDNPQKAPEF